MSDLTDRMRTCAAHILARKDEQERAVLDAADLLIEASNLLEAAPEPLGTPMEVIELKPPTPLTPPEALAAAWTDMKPTGTWIDPGGALPQPRGTFNPRACPQCDSRTTKKVIRLDSKLMQVCPVCSAQWEWKRSNPT